MTLRSLHLRLAATALLLASGGCRLPFASGDRLDDARHDLAAARARWAANRNGTYTYTVTPVCFCPARAIRVTLVGGLLVGDEYVDTGDPVPATELFPPASVDQMLAHIQAAIDRRAASIDAHYDERGVPVTVFIDNDTKLQDDERGWVVDGGVPATALR